MAKGSRDQRDGITTRIGDHAFAGLEIARGSVLEERLVQRRQITEMVVDEAPTGVSFFRDRHHGDAQQPLSLADASRGLEQLAVPIVGTQVGSSLRVDVVPPPICT